jgi:hypothetical protein
MFDNVSVSHFGRPANPISQDISAISSTVDMYPPSAAFKSLKCENISDEGNGFFINGELTNIRERR